MLRKETLPLILCVLCVLSWTTFVSGADWPQWGGSDGRNMVSDAKDLPDSFVPGQSLPSEGGVDPQTTERVKWTARLGSLAYGNPTVADGRVFVGTDDATLAGDSRFQRTRGGMVQCFDEATGKLLWRLVTPKRDELPADTHFSHQWLGTCSSPTVDGDRVYAVTSAGEVVCLDVDGLADGNDGPFREEGRYMVPPDEPPVELASGDADIIWCFDMIDQAGACPHDAASCSALIHGEMLYVGTSNGVDASHLKMIAPEAPNLIVLEKKTGRLVATDGEKIGRRMWHAQWSSPSSGTVNGRTLIFFGGGDGVCYAFEALSEVPETPVELKKVWFYDCNPPEYRFRDGKPIPYYDGDKRKRHGNNDDGLYLGPSQIIATPVFHNNRVYLPIGQDPAHGRGRGLMHCIDATGTGDVTTSGKVWSYDGIERSLSSATIADGLVYCPDVSGKLHCLDAGTGKCYWVHDTKTEVWSSPLVADGKVYLGTKKDFLVFAAGKEPKVLSETYLGSPVYSSAVEANGVLYVTSQRYLWAVADVP
ncbi:MAG TPA: PQQ-binding-like beta-propeller repeat protein [Thermoguttaceae bacterium]|nr:PQQ-binding-like beta-propeller repeat protein [Thermoguttaceae bacterium]